nr:ATP-binding protein [uncultured Sphaerochaeta sp.]
MERKKGRKKDPMNESGIRSLLLETSGTSFEACRSLEQDLTFITLKEEMDKRQIAFGSAQMETLKMIGSDKLFTNLAMLLSDQCSYTCKVAVFQGRDFAVFRDRKEFSGSVLKQLSDVYRFLATYNKTKARFNGLLREDTLDYPQEAIREALLNSIIHRDYLFSGSTIINVFDDRIEFISLGGLMRGLSMEAITMGISQSRNPNLASVFYRLQLVESYGTGIRKIMHLYKEYLRKPEFKAAEGAFSCVLPNSNEEGTYTQKHEYHEDSVGESLNAEKASILYHAKARGSISRKEVEDLVGLKTTKAFRLLKELCAEGQLTQQTCGKFTRYIPLGE